jgi:hypothetical protein
VAPNDGFAKAKTVDNKQELVGEHTQKLVKTAALGACGRRGPIPRKLATDAGVYRLRAGDEGMTPKRFRILSATIETARSLALSDFRCWANRCAEPGM